MFLCPNIGINTKRHLEAGPSWPKISLLPSTDGSRLSTLVLSNIIWEHGAQLSVVHN